MEEKDMAGESFDDDYVLVSRSDMKYDSVRVTGSDEESTDEDDDSTLDDFVASPRTYGQRSRSIYDYQAGNIQQVSFPAERSKAVSMAAILMTRVLPHLPAMSLCRFQVVSKKWLGWISSPFFAHTQTTQFREVSGLLFQFPGEVADFIALDPDAYGVPSPSLAFLPDSVLIRTTCNGLLVCEAPWNDNCYYVCSPATKTWRVLPPSMLYHGPGSAVALAFEPKMMDFFQNYELICAVRVPDESSLRFEIYSSRSDSWRTCEEICMEEDDMELTGDGFFEDGYAYWASKSGRVVAFNVREERCGLLNLPPGSNGAGALSTMKGELCYLLPRDHDGELVMEVFGDINMRLKRTVRLHRDSLFGDQTESSYCRALACLRDGSLIFSVGRSIFVVDESGGRKKRLATVSGGGFAKYLPYINSLATVSGPQADFDEIFSEI